MLFEDESMIRDYQAIQEDLVPSRETTHHSSTGKHRGVKLLATVDYETGHIVWQEDEQCLPETFLSFLQGHGDLSNRETETVLDNARIHHASCFGRFWKRKKIGLSLCTCLHTALS
ncbi:transposase [Paenibacillus larvae]|nr:transposase [Paenibacillus larvae]MDT2191407.1 transposase [Paenibacillus larvae]